MNKTELVAKALELGVEQTEEMLNSLTNEKLGEICKTFEGLEGEDLEAANKALDEEWKASVAEAEAKLKAEEEAKEKAEADKKAKAEKKDSSKVKALFKAYPQNDECFETTDSTLFLGENDAVNHQVYLDRNSKEEVNSKKRVKKHSRK